MRSIIASILNFLPWISVIAVLGPAAAADATWQHFYGDLQARKYSPHKQITPDNVGRLQVAWRMHTGDKQLAEEPDKPGTVWSATPLFVNDTLYLGTPFYRIFALEPDTGHVKWIYDGKPPLEALTQFALKNRGVAYWQADTIVANQPCQKRIYIGTVDAKLHSVDADTGKPCADFGENGILDANQWNDRQAEWPLSLLQPPTVFDDTLFLGWAGKDWADAKAPPGAVFALDARTGALRWTFETIPAERAATTGTANVWAGMSVDPERRLLFLPVSSPSPNMYGGNRLDPLPLATSVTALDVDSGDMVWSRQLVHHDLWDYDTNAAPTLVDIARDGHVVPALVQTSKQGFLYVLNRETGEPLYPVSERPVPASTVPGERAASTQPFVPLPEPTNGDRWPGVFDLADRLSFGYCSRTAARLRNDGRFTPPSLEGTLIYPGSYGGVEWGGGAVDPDRQMFVVNSSVGAQIFQLLKRSDYEAAVRQTGEGTYSLFPMTGTPYGLRLANFLNPLGMPCWKPPFGLISAYDLKTGALIWRKPFGQIQKWGFYMPQSWGSITIGGPVITASGLVFIGASMDSRVRAIDLQTGKVLWKAPVSAPAVSIPAIYTYKGKQYVAFAVGGNSIMLPDVSDELVAFSLP